MKLGSKKAFFKNMSSVGYFDISFILKETNLNHR